MINVQDKVCSFSLTFACSEKVNLNVFSIEFRAAVCKSKFVEALELGNDRIHVPCSAGYHIKEKNYYYRVLLPIFIKQKYVA